MFVTEPLHLLRYAVLDSKIFVQTGDCTDLSRHRPGSIQPIGNTVIGKLCTIADHPSIDV